MKHEGLMYVMFVVYILQAEQGVVGSSGSSSNRVGGRHHGVGGGSGQWKPALQSIAEIGT